MARNLALSSNHPLIVYNRTVKKSEALAEEAHGKVAVAQSIPELVEGELILDAYDLQLVASEVSFENVPHYNQH